LESTPRTRGQKARLLFALASFDRPHLLILDEPTNHLDVDAREALIHAVNAYEGAVILISHDRHLLEACADRLWLVKDGTVRPYEGDMESYRAECLAERGAARAARSESGETGAHSRASRQEQRRHDAARRAELAPLKKALQAVELKVEKLSAEVAALDGQLADSGLYERDPDRAARLLKKRGELAKELELAEEQWVEASEAYEVAHV
jgi:ATP-binding cassette subfamily F protein 3